MDKNQVHIRRMIQFTSPQFAHPQDHERSFRKTNFILFLEMGMDFFQGNLQQGFRHGSPFLQGLDKSFTETEVTKTDPEKLTILPASQDIFKIPQGLWFQTADPCSEFLQHAFGRPGCFPSIKGAKLQSQMRISDQFPGKVVTTTENAQQLRNPGGCKIEGC